MNAKIINVLRNSCGMNKDIRFIVKAEKTYSQKILKPKKISY